MKLFGWLISVALLGLSQAGVACPTHEAHSAQTKASEQTASASSEKENSLNRTEPQEKVAAADPASQEVESGSAKVK